MSLSMKIVSYCGVETKQDMTGSSSTPYNRTSISSRAMIPLCASHHDSSKDLRSRPSARDISHKEKSACSPSRFPQSAHSNSVSLPLSKDSLDTASSMTLTSLLKSATSLTRDLRRSEK